MSTGRVAGRATSSHEATHYEVLGVSPTADGPHIRARYRQLSKTHHPDAGGDRHKFEALAHAHAVLADPDARAAYDRALAEPEPTPIAPSYADATPVADGYGEPVYFEDDRYELSTKQQIVRLAVYVLALVGLVALLIFYGGNQVERAVDNVWPDGINRASDPVEPAPPVEASETADPSAPVGHKGHNGLSASQSAQRWLAAFQALSGVNPQVDQADAEATYDGAAPEAAPGVLCATYTKTDFWVALSAVSLELADVQVELNHHLSRAVAECTNFEDIVPTLSIALGSTQATIADRLRKVERLADEAVWTASGP